jgi:hypothetical protein
MIENESMEIIARAATIEKCLMSVLKDKQIQTVLRKDSLEFNNIERLVEDPVCCNLACNNT